MKSKIQEHIKINRFKVSKQLKIITLIYLFCFVGIVNAQQKVKKLSHSIETNKDVTIDLNTSHTNIVIDTWNKGYVEVEAYVESKELSKEELNEVLKNWSVNVDGSMQNVAIRTGADSNHNFDWNFDFTELEALDALKDLKLNIADLPEGIVIPEMNFNIPELPEMPELPELPELPEGINNIHFDSDRYKKEGEKYLEEWSKEYEDKYGKDMQLKMEAWAKNFADSDFEKKMEEWGKKFGKNFEKNFGKDFELKMEKWGEEFGKDFDNKISEWAESYAESMEKHAKALEKHADSKEKEYAKQLEKKEKEIEKRLKEREVRVMELKHLDGKHSKVKKTIKIKMPKDAKLKVNVRHGEIKFATVVNDLKANLSHTKLVANSIDGSETSINASYAPVLVTNWNAGELILKYVDNAKINNVQALMLRSNSSNLIIDKLYDNALVDGSFGDFSINSIADSFSSLNIILDNSDAVIKLPETEFNFQFFGTHSSLKHPKKTSKNLSSFSDGTTSNGKTIIVNAKYSNVIMQ